MHACIQSFDEEICRKKAALEDASVNWRIILKWFLKQYDEMAWTEIMWVRVVTICGLL
jgi:hypothetical protein